MTTQLLATITACVGSCAVLAIVWAWCSDKIVAKCPKELDDQR